MVTFKKIINRLHFIEQFYRIIDKKLREGEGEEEEEKEKKEEERRCSRILAWT